MDQESANFLDLDLDSDLIFDNEATTKKNSKACCLKHYWVLGILIKM